DEESSFASADLDPRVRRARRVLPCVAEEVLEERPQQAGIALAGEAARDDDLDVPVRSAPSELRDDVVREGAEIDRRPLEARVTDVGQGEEVLDEPRHVRARAIDALDVADGGVGERVAPVLEEDRAGAADDG